MKQQTKTMSAADNAKDKSALLKLFTDEVKDIYWAEKHLAKLFLKWLEEEKTTDVGLTVIAEGFVNEATAQEVE